MEEHVEGAILAMVASHLPNLTSQKPSEARMLDSSFKLDGSHRLDGVGGGGGGGATRVKKLTSRPPVPDDLPGEMDDYEVRKKLSRSPHIGPEDIPIDLRGLEALANKQEQDGATSGLKIHDNGATSGLKIHESDFPPKLSSQAMLGMKIHKKLIFHPSCPPTGWMN
eukprot:g12085.t1